MEYQPNSGGAEELRARSTHDRCRRTRECLAFDRSFARCTVGSVQTPILDSRSSPLPGVRLLVLLQTVRSEIGQDEHLQIGTICESVVIEVVPAR